MRAARWTTPSLRLEKVVTGTSRLPAPFEPNPNLLRPSLPSQCPTKCREDIFPHPVLHTTLSARWFHLQVCGHMFKCNISRLYVKQRLRNNCIISYYLFLFQLRHMYSTIGRKYLFTRLYNGRFQNASVFTEILMSP